jgi:hypothetical protein
MFLSSCRVVESDLSSDDTKKETEAETLAEETIAETDLETDVDTDVDTNAETDIETNAETTADSSTKKVTKIELDKYQVVIIAGETDMPWVTMYPEDAENKGEIWESSDKSVATVNHYGKITGVKAGECVVTVTSKDNPEVKAEVKVKVTGDAELTYIKGILIANKTYKLPASYAPGVDKTAEAALNKMIKAAADDGITLFLKSGYRSYETQKYLYNNYVARDGVAAADRYSARAGHSEHQTGLAFDLNSLEQSFGETKEGKWLAEHCHEYGFIIRYPKDKENITGYMYEPWHVRYLGDVAEDVYESGKCLEEYLGITSKYAN